MRFTAVAAVSIALGALSIDAAHAERLDAADWFRRAEALVQALVGAARDDREIIAPPSDLDPKMALVPPLHGTMRIIVPPGEAGRRP